MTVTPERVALAGRVKVLRDRGLTHREVAAEVGISRSYASVLATDPLGEDQARRRDTYKGACEQCGAETKSDGTSQASRLCMDCSKAEQMIWTRERIIAAICEFHVRNGRTPSSSEWLLHRTDDVPATAAVLKRFGSWANAIEAAGFERPRVGRYLIRERGSAVDYFVFRLNGKAELIGKTEAHSVVEAIGALADAEGRYGAVSVSALKVRDVKHQLSVVRPTAENAA